MDVCIRAGYYEVAYALTNFGIQLQQRGLTENPMIKTVADRLVEARHYLLDELFNRFAGPIDLASSIQVVSNIRKIPYLSPIQLRVSVLQYRDVYLEKQLIDLKSEPDFLLRMVEVYRDCMYDTMVLYFAVFPEGEIIKRTVDSRWDVWHYGNSSAILSEWVIRNLEAMFGHLSDVGDKSANDVGVLASKLMSFSQSFGRMGVDFRPLVVEKLHNFVVRRFTTKVEEATKTFTKNSSIRIEHDVLNETRCDMLSSAGQPVPPSLLAFWDDLCIYGNVILEALNEMRNALSPALVYSIRSIIFNSLKSVFQWLDRFVPQPSQKDYVMKALFLLSRHFIPFLSSCLFSCFPYEKCCRPFFFPVISMEEYKEKCTFQVSELCANCDSNVTMLSFMKSFQTEDRSVGESVNTERKSTAITSESRCTSENTEGLALGKEVKTDAAGDEESSSEKDSVDFTASSQSVETVVNDDICLSSSEKQIDKGESRSTGNEVRDSEINLLETTNVKREESLSEIDIDNLKEDKNIPEDKDRKMETSEIQSLKDLDL
ncbi:hypothetical protein AB6A40_003007 [Gnathostoma spinigerum]|uniref:Conserved oligomeric Golgi complex subunit 8 n=1 Tax=Gnathostoma spinigerum TaxID=75299 RepID=A0ABD6E892_9BILA